MKTKSFFTNIEKGQVLPIVVLSLFALIAMAALMIDGGMLLSHRRTAQAAADAGALAGARARCPGYEGPDYHTTATNYVNSNNADVVLIEPIPDNGVRVETSVNSQSFFAGIFDMMNLTAVAVAEANCTRSHGVAVNLPIAFPCLEKEYNDDGELIGCANIIPEVLSIIMDSDATADYCYHDQNNPDSDIICHDVTSDSSRGWLSLDGGEHGTIPECWLKGDCVPPLPLIYPPTWLSHLAGLTTSDFKMLKNYLDREFIIPIYDQESEHKPNPCPEGDTCILRSGTGHNAYRIIGFAQFTLTCVHEAGDHFPIKGSKLFGSPCSLRNDLMLDPNFDVGTSIKSIEGIFTEGTVSFGAGDGKLKGGLYVVQLIK